MFHALLKRKQAQEKQEFLRAGIVASAIINALGASKKPVTPQQFVPKYDEVERNTDDFDLSNLSPEAQKAHIVGQLPAYLRDGKMFYNKQVLFAGQKDTENWKILGQ